MSAKTTEGGGHTPGPWMAAAGPSSIVGWPVVAPRAGGRSICNVTWLPGLPDAMAQEVRANGRLIAAARDLYHALRMCIQRIERPEMSPDANVVLEKARAALLRALPSQPRVLEEGGRSFLAERESSASPAHPMGGDQAGKGGA